ncbi:MAG: hypothetical protein K2X29_01385 [Candidatus Obscuribacterales bacterium]|nr:hypothetical protein [Candidatus Obscuribacterales bacterium]
MDRFDEVPSAKVPAEESRELFQGSIEWSECSGAFGFCKPLTQPRANDHSWMELDKFSFRKDGSEVVFGSGNSVTMKEDGSAEIKGEVKKVSTSDDGETYLYFDNYEMVHYDKKGIESITVGGGNAVIANRITRTCGTPKPQI